MKNFKHYLREFIIKNNNRDGGDGASPYNPQEEVKRYMDGMEFRYTTKQGDLIHFDSALDAARAFAKHLQQHEDGHNHSVQEEIPHMIRYFQNSATTHEHALALITDAVVNEANLPPHLHSHVPATIASIEAEEANEHEYRKKLLSGQTDFSGRPFSDVGFRIAKLHHVMPIDVGDGERHPYEYDQGHHLMGVMDEIEDSHHADSHRAIGYVIRRKS